MAGHFHLGSLLSGPTTHIEHDETGDGTFKDLTGSVPLSMLAYFSTTIRDGYHRAAGPNWPPQQVPTRVRIIGGDPTSHLDIIHWMNTCCSQNMIVPLTSIIASPTRFILAMTSIHILGITYLEKELSALHDNLQNEMLDIDTVGRVFASGESSLSEMRDAICACVAGYFFAGRLQDVERWMYLGKMNRRFNEGICRVLETAGDGNKLETWERKEAWRYPTSTSEPPGGDRQTSGHSAEGPMMCGASPSSNFQVHQTGYGAASYHQISYHPSPHPRALFMPPYQQAHHPSANPYATSNQGINQPPPSTQSYPNQVINDRATPWRTPSPVYTSHTNTPQSRHRRVHFDQADIPSRATTLPPAAWEPFRPPSSSHQQYHHNQPHSYQQPHGGPYNSHSFSFSQGAVPTSYYPPASRQYHTPMHY